jgi:murein DD-endopeptidase MepM/ murein hydrolase activator NlpD
MYTPEERCTGMKIIGVLVLAAFLASCASMQGEKRSENPAGSAHEREGGGVWHRVMEGQTLWRISKTYRVTLEELKEANDLVDTVHVPEGAWLYVPGAERVLYVQGNGGSLPPETRKLDFAWPLKGEVVRSFGKLKNDFNYGIDLRAEGSQNVLASEGGTVILSGIIRGYGNTIIIEHENDFCSLYSRNIQSLVEEGQPVRKNTVIARLVHERAAAAGKEGEGNVFHYELFYRGKPVNPLYYLP